MNSLDTIIKYFEGMEFQTCCNGHECGCYGLPIDPEYYMLQDLYKLREEIKELKEERNKYKSYAEMRGYGES